MSSTVFNRLNTNNDLHGAFYAQSNNSNQSANAHLEMLRTNKGHCFLHSRSLNLSRTFQVLYLPKMIKHVFRTCICIKFEDKEA